MKLIFTIEMLKISSVSNRDYFIHVFPTVLVYFWWITLFLFVYTFSFPYLPLISVWYMQHYILSWINYLPVTRVHQDVLVESFFSLGIQTHQMLELKQFFSPAVPAPCVHLLLCPMWTVQRGGHFMLLTFPATTGSQSTRDCEEEDKRRRLSSVHVCSIRAPFRGKSHLWVFVHYTLGDSSAYRYA